ncbi:uncharacterized protein LOC115633107 [Scaptodrosophila lebanonensis]|uniref:Uncharacterized protein LOC115633107 n=1 Tax=Drosophila lebanonensis TaxID=7225 RepID=A0A6J2UCZ6_DROLE|nr:uncharacterized protein LOC115633107 [Scaptodrosophila lebanonensis]XP_030386352.1 uncharacterized protein LOC115633107 [Scaptodrosophila lebanonensis]
MNSRRRARAGSRKHSYASAAGGKQMTPEIYEMNVKICRLVERYPCMYDRSDPNYMKKATIESAWEEIGKEMHDAVPSCKERWRNIRSSYARSINVNRLTIHNRITPYYLSEELKFLSRHITPGIPIPTRAQRSNQTSGDDGAGHRLNNPKKRHSRNLRRTNCENAPELDDSSFYSGASNLEEEGSEDGQDERKPVQGLPSQSQRSKSENSAVETLPKKRKFPGTSDNEVKADNIGSEPSSTPLAMDCDEAFLRGVLPEMRHMSFHQKLFFKRRVYELIGEIFPESEDVQPSINGETSSTQHDDEKPPEIAMTSQPPLQHLGLVTRSYLQLPALRKRPSKD